MTSNAKAALWLTNEISQRLCKVFSSVAVNPEITISFVFFQRVLPSFRLKQREDEKCRARESLTAENHCLLCCSPGQRRACVWSAPSSKTSLLSSTVIFFGVGQVGKRRERKEKSQRMVLSGEMQCYVPHPSLLLMYRIAKLRLHKGFLGVYIGCFYCTRACLVLGIIFGGINEVFIS